MGVYWAGPLLVGLLVFFLLAAVVPPAREPPPTVAGERALTEEEVETAGAVAVFVNVMFWLFLITAITLLIVGIVA